MKGFFDLDAVKYSVASVGQKNTIKVIHTQSGDEYLFNTRTEFHGRNKARDQGWLGEVNKERDSPLLSSEFTIEDIVTPEPIENVLHSCKMTIEGAVEASGATSWQGVVGEGESFRVHLGNLQKYKGARTSLVRPYHFDAVVEYIKKKYKPEIVTGIEADDWLVTTVYNQPDKFIIGVDKDFYGCPVKFYNMNRHEEGVVDCNGFGKLWLNDKGDVRGTGRLFKYFQVSSEDDVDCYKANCFSNIKWGAKSAYKALVECKSDKEAFESLVSTFKHLYPEPQKIVSWKLEDLEIDWLFVLQEMFDMAHLQRWENDRINVKDVLTKLNINYEDIQ